MSSRTLRRCVSLFWAVLLSTPITAAPAPARSGRPGKPLVLAAYYTWYHAGDHPRAPWSMWTRPEARRNPLAQTDRRPGEPPISPAARPLAGLYDSGDALTAEWHVRLAKAAGLDAFLVSWWGTVRGRNVMFEAGVLAASEKLGFKVALLDERAQFHNDFKRYREALTEALGKYKESRAYLRIDGRPVVYLYQVARKPGLTADEFVALKRHVESRIGRVYWIVDKIAHDAAAQRRHDRNRVKRIPPEWLATPGIDAFGSYSTFSHFRAFRYAELAGKYRYLAKLAHDAGKKILLPVHPGHDNSRFSESPYVMPRRDGQTLRDYLRAAREAPADFILVTSWNEWPETTAVEPSSDWPDPFLYLKILAEFKGIPFVKPPEPHPGRRK